jgi:hypothetical protein
LDCGRIASHAKNKRVQQGGNKKMVGATGFEPATSWTQTTRSSQAELRSDASPSLQETAIVQEHSGCRKAVGVVE